MRPHATRFLTQLTDSVFAGAFIAAFDTPTLVDAIGREERAIADIGHQARLTQEQSAGAVQELEETGYVERVGMLVRLTPSGARWYAMQQGRTRGR